MGTANRISTALDLHIGDINFQSGVIILRKTKNRKQQIIPLSVTLAEILQGYLQIRGGAADDYVFCNEYGEQASCRTYQQLVRRIEKGVLKKLHAIPLDIRLQRIGFICLGRIYRWILRNLIRLTI